MTQYMLSVHHAEGAPQPSPDEFPAIVKAVDVFNEKVMATGQWVFGGGLQPPESATTVRVVDGDTVMTDGPFAETKEQLGGFWILECADLDEALKLAAEASVACREPVEVRPFQDEPPAGA